jgi:crotonobetaine/carnitine-CoA ligase
MTTEGLHSSRGSEGADAGHARDSSRAPLVTLTAVLAERVAQSGDRPFLVTDAGTISYREFDRHSTRVAHGLERLGISEEEPVLIMLPNTLEFVATWCAIAKLAAIEVPVNTAYRGTILSHVINDSTAETMIVDHSYLESITAALPHLTHLKRLIVTGSQLQLDSARRLGSLDLLHFEALIADDDTPIPERANPHTLMAVMYTSGTTGPSKGVMITHTHAYHYALACRELLDLQSSDVYYAPLPLFHIAGQWALVYAACLAGAQAVLTDRFSIDRFWSDVRRTGATATFLLGAMGSFLHRQPQRKEDSTTPLEKAMIVPLFPEVDDFKKRFAVEVTTTYASTEVNVPLRAGFQLPNPRTCGTVEDSLFEARIVDEHDQELPDGEVGEFVVRPKLPWLVMAGYWRHPEWTASAWRNLWLHTGDAMYRDRDGNLYFSDRVKDCIRRRGENISSIEVENEILAHPSVQECAVVPVEAEETEQEVLAFIVAKPGQQVDPTTLIRFLEPRMAYFMVPRYVEFLDDLPKTPTGKIKKHELRRHGVGASTWDRVKAGVTLSR